MAVNKVVINGETKIDLTSDTVTADKLIAGTTAHDKSGAKITGTFSPPTKEYKIASGTFVGKDLWYVTINHGLGTQNVFVIIQAVTTDGTPVIISRSLATAVVAMPKSMLINPTQEYKLTSDGVSQQIIQSVAELNMSTEGKTYMNSGYIAPTNDTATNKGVYAIDDNSVTVGTYDRFINGKTYTWKVIGLMGGLS